MTSLYKEKNKKAVARLLLLIMYIETVIPAYAIPRGYVYKGHAEYNYEWNRLSLDGNMAYDSVNSPTTLNFLHGEKSKSRLPVKGSQKTIPGKKFIGGPGQPEMSSFKSVNASNMVDLFTGDFSYNIPLLDVGGYPVNIHYNSGVTMDQEASWVGLGWNINPGTISRSMRGLPDDFNGDDKVTRSQNIYDNKTVGVTLGADLEILGTPMLGAGFKFGVFHNNYNGWGTEIGINASINSGKWVQGDKNTWNDSSAIKFTAGLSLSNNSQSGFDISPSLSVRMGSEAAKMNGTAYIGTNYNSRTGISGLQLGMGFRTYYNFYNNSESAKESTRESASTGLNTYLSFATPSYTPTITMPFTSFQYSFTGKIGTSSWAAHPNAFSEGYVSNQYIKAGDRVQAMPAYGYLYLTKSKSDPLALQDFNREKDITFNENVTPNIAIPQYTYDVYSISGEGIGGMFRPYRGEIGYIRDHYVATRSETDRGSVDIGFGAPPPNWHAGIDFYVNNAQTITKVWEGGNAMLPFVQFLNSDSTFNEVYFRNPGEKAINTKGFYQSFGGDNLMRVKLSGEKGNVAASSIFTLFQNSKPTGAEISVSQPLARKERDKRSQVITYLRADEASVYGLDKIIKSYKENTIPLGSCTDTLTPVQRIDNIVHRKHHLSEVDVINPDGRRYVYGLPAYNIEQKDATFAIDKETNANNLSKGLATYVASGWSPDNSVNNIKGKDHFFTKDSIPAYAHSFLLTGILSPDYVDITGNGITDDDLGDAVKFNYSRIFGSESSYYKWRTPSQANLANYNEGLKSYNRDDKATYMYGQKEVWYLNSIESKTMIAVFRLSSDRKDDYPVLGEYGGVDSLKPLRKLDRIDLYTKADLIKNGNRARPVKTVHFSYNYELCNGAVNSNYGFGKLTLKKVWFTYNGIDNGAIKNAYQFYYNPINVKDSTSPKYINNPGHNSNTYDRWGNYKDASTNPGNLNNVDYPYAIQDSSQAAQYAKAWHLTDIKLPSGGLLRINYEADDYGYVQNKRASRFFKITGFGTDSSSTPQKVLYLKMKNNDFKDYFFVYVDVPVAPQNKNELYARYLEGINKLFFKVAVKMPSDRWGNGYEFVPTYAEAESYGIVSGNSNRIWIKLKPINGVSPLVKAALQFLRLNIPAKAYPNSEIGDNVRVIEVVKTLFTVISDIKNTVIGFENNKRNTGICSEADTSKSLIRLDCPDFKKFGGGIRVKKVEIFDHWKTMTNQKESSYGQEYFYTTTTLINGQKTTISSGVASYEPNIGNDENPFREPIEYTERVAPLAPANNLFTELPFCESFFPSAMVGYSSVRVRTINNKAKSANGWEETIFYTSKDFPTLTEYTPFDGDSKKRYAPKLRQILRINSTHQLTLSQGFKIELNDMNGKIKSQATYAENDPNNPIQYVENFYKLEKDTSFRKKLSNTVWVVDSANGHIDTAGIVGKDIEVMMDFRQQESKTVAGNVSANLDIVPFFFLPLPIPTAISLPQIEDSRYRSAATVKIVQRYGILDSVVVIDKGSIVTTKNLAYDAETGEVLVSRTNNEFNDPVYNFSYPAHWAFSGMGPAYRNVDVLLRHKKILDGKMFEDDGVTATNTKYFESGDLIIVKAYEKLTATYNGSCGTYTFQPSKTLNKIWAIDAAKGKEGNKGIYFIDSLGKPYTANIDTLRILRSGKRNMTDASVGSVSSLASPIRMVSVGKYKIVIDSATHVVSAAATSYKDLWAVDDHIYAKDSCFTYQDTEVVALVPSQSLLMKKVTVAPLGTEYFSTIPNARNFTASMKNYPSGDPKENYTYETSSIIKFDYGIIPTNATIISANLSLFGYNISGVWNASDVGNEDWSGYNQAHYSQNPPLHVTNKVSFQRVKTDWSNITSYESWVPGPEEVIVNAPGTSCGSNAGINLKTMVDSQFHNASGNNGIIMHLTDIVSNLSSIQLRSQSYCTGLSQGGSVNNTSCASCSNATLFVTYVFAHDTCVKLCKKLIDTSGTNPYRAGILGNWRMDRAYTYYYDRKESDASVTVTNIRKEGELKDFTPYWTLNDTALKPVTDTSKWVWNSAMSLYSRRGFEVENYDPLGRFNAGLYGYLQTMPVAVGQNSKYRQLLSDGFEDYNYQIQTCNNCPPTKEFDFLKNNSAASIDTLQSHSGVKSLKINTGGQAQINFKVVSLSTDSLKPALSIKVDSSSVVDTVVTPRGTGLRGNYSGVPSPCPGSQPSSYTLNPVVNGQGPIYYGSDGQPAIPLSGMCDRYFNVTWSGKIQPKYSDFYSFSANASGDMDIIVDGTNVLHHYASGAESGNKIFLTAGQLYSLNIIMTNTAWPPAYAKVIWTHDKSMEWEVIPKENLYNPDSTGSNTINTAAQKICKKLNNTKPLNVLRPVYSPLKNDRLIVSGWMKIDTTDCDPADITGTPFNVSFTGGTATVNFVRTGLRIEKWQRYEADITVPAGATAMTLTLQSIMGRNVFFDDIRVQPYNSNVKAYVYDPVSLRLMAELDENNFGTYYEYDDDGTLIRVKKETERGIKTIKETRSTLIKNEQ